MSRQSVAWGAVRDGCGGGAGLTCGDGLGAGLGGDTQPATSARPAKAASPVTARIGPPFVRRSCGKCAAIQASRPRHTALDAQAIADRQCKSSGAPCRIATRPRPGPTRARFGRAFTGCSMLGPYGTSKDWI
jgi:hypothetical protein